MNRSQKVLLLLTSAAVIPVLMASGVQTGKKAEEAVKQDETIASIASYLKEQSPDIPDEMARDIASFVYVESKSHEVDYRLVLAVMKVESNYRQFVVSPDGSRGFMQINPSLARGLAKEAGIPYRGLKDLYDVQKNIRLGTHYLSKVIKLFDDVPKALFAYSVGHHKAKRLLARDINPHTPYTKRVVAEYKKNTEKMVSL